jgi:hypothetical protein
MSAVDAQLLSKEIGRRVDAFLEQQERRDLALRLAKKLKPRKEK